ncbi:MAG: hypothetical protein ACOX6T_13515 [Myxococcales bacterium]|jgi:DnaJ-class molecular chaperone
MSIIDFGPDELELPETEPVEEAPVSEQTLCPGCSGKGRYVGLTKVEDPCSVCGGKGVVEVSRAGPEYGE